MDLLQRAYLGEGCGDWNSHDYWVIVINICLYTAFKIQNLFVCIKSSFEASAETKMKTVNTLVYYYIRAESDIDLRFIMRLKCQPYRFNGV
jgi:hypothetical protein